LGLTVARQLLVEYKGVMDGSLRSASRQASGEIESVGSAADNTSRRGSSMWGKIGAGVGALGRAAAAGAAAVGGLAVAGGAVGIKTAAGLETGRIAFSTMLGSAQKADGFLRDLADFAAKTPFDLPGLQESASSLISIGIDSKKVIPIMTTLGNVTSGMGTGAEGIQRATVALQQMNAAGRISGEDLNQLRDAGIPVFDLLSAATGKSKEEVAKLAQTGKLGKKELEALMSALESGKGMERFAGLMDKQSESVSGLWATLKDATSMGLAEGIQPMIPLIKEGLGGAISLVGKATPYMVQGMQWLADTINRARPQVSAIAAELGPKLGAGLAVMGDKIRDAVPAFLSFVQGINWAELGGTLAGLGRSLGSLGANFAESGVEVGALTPLLQKGADMLGFLARHTDALAAAIPYLVGAYGLLRAAQAANQLIGRGSALGMIAQTAATFTLAAANRSLAASNTQAAATQGTANAAENVGLLTRIRSTAVLVAQKGAQLAVTAATRAAAAGQWLLNAAMSANPVGLVIAGLVLLGVGLVMLWKKSETFRTIVMGAWEGIKSAASFVVDWFAGTALPAIVNVAKFIGAQFMSLVTVFVVVGQGIAAAFRFGVDLVVSAAQWLAGAVVAHLTFLKNVGLTIVSALVSSAVGTFVFFRDTGAAIVNGLAQLAIGSFRFMRDATLAVIVGLRDGAIGGFTFLRDGALRIVDGVRDGAVARFTTLKDSVLNVTRNLVDSFGSLFGRLRDAANEPIKFVLGTVVNKGLIAGVNWIADKLHLDKLKVAPIPGYRAGGPTHRGADSTPRLAELHGNEHVWTAREMRRFPGGHGAMSKWRRDVLAGRAAPTMGSYLAGGRVSPVNARFGRWGSYPGHTGLDAPVPTGTPVVSFMAGVVNAVKHLATSFGNHVRVNHGGFEGIYAHLSRTSVDPGQRVDAGTLLGLSGSSGNSTGPHLHFEIRSGGRPIDPTPLLNGAALPDGGGGGGGFGDIIGGFIRDRITGPVKGMLGRMPGAGTVFGQFATGAATNLMDSVVGKVTELFGASGGDPGGTGVERWRGLITSTLAGLGLPTTPDYVNAWLRQVQSESGGNPRAVQGIRDVNSGGNEAVGLLQVIPGTFARYRNPNLPNDRMNAAASAWAGINYANQRYGPRMLSVIGHGHGYARGGIMREGLSIVGENGPEAMLTAGSNQVYPPDMLQRIIGDAAGAGAGGMTEDQVSRIIEAILARQEIDVNVLLDQGRLRQLIAAEVSRQTRRQGELVDA